MVFLLQISCTKPENYQKQWAAVQDAGPSKVKGALLVWVVVLHLVARAIRNATVKGLQRGV